MGKIVGLIVSWGNEKWLDLVIKQALYACDEVILSIGAHSKAMEKYEDGSLELAKSYGDRVKIVPVVNKGNHSDTKAATMNLMLNVSDNYKAGNWVWLLDDDEFWFKEDIDKMKEAVVKDEYNYIFTMERFFYINTKNYLEVDSGRGRLWKIENGTHSFKPTNNWTGPRDRVLNMGVYMYHYSLLMNPYAKMDFWGTEYSHGQNHKVQWMKETYMNYDFNNQDVWLEGCKDKFGKRSAFPMGHPNFHGDDNGHLFKYYGKHPELIEEAGLTNIIDFRKEY
jgi:hypothetical protein